MYVSFSRWHSRPHRCQSWVPGSRWPRWQGPTSRSRCRLPALAGQTRADPAAGPPGAEERSPRGQDMTGTDSATGTAPATGIDGPLFDRMAGVVGPEHVLTGERVHADYGHDEALTVAAVTPAAVVRPATAAQVAEILRIAGEHSVPVTARGSGT